MSVMPIVHRVVAGSILGVAIYVGADVAGEYTTYVILRDQANSMAQQNDSLNAQIGAPYTLGPWYNARIGGAPGSNVLDPHVPVPHVMP